MLTHKTFTVNGFQENTYLLYDDDTKEGVLIDPGAYAPRERALIDSHIIENGVNLKAIWLTHSHIDHVLGLRWAVDTFKIPYFQSAEDRHTLHAVPSYAAPVYGIHDFALPNQQSGELKAGESIALGACTFRTLATPGHAPGHLSFYSPDFGVVAGDALFNGSIGRTDLPGGNYSQLEQSIKTQLYTLPEETIVFPGHGPSTTIGHEKRFNPFVRD